jgi:uncharacterized membrane-anchored protein
VKELAHILARIPRLWLFAAAGLIQVAAIAFMVGDRIMILRTGTEVKLRTRALDPRDPLRGDYVTLGNDITSVDAGALKDTPSSGRSSVVYVKIAPDAEGYYKPVSVHRDPVPLAAGEVLIRGRTANGTDCGEDRRAFCGSLTLDYGIEKFFVPQGEGRVIEAARNQGKVAIVAAVTSGGRAAIKRLLIDGKPVYDEPLF